MHSDQWQKIEKLFHRAADLSPSKWADFLDAQCPGDPETVREVLSLLRCDRQAMRFLEPAVPEDIAGETPPNPAIRMTGMRTGPYRLENRIGEGGMGIVFLAERDDDQFRKKVAVKIVKGAFAGEDLRRRFLVERQILARLQHPSIAQLLDGGVTADGSPYFVMEYVDGLPVDEYCDTHRLNITERLTLFLQICEAVHYAHQNLVVHRDLKPNHILVTPEGIPKLLDFGIAKLMETPDEGTAPLTREGLRLLTPEYASPEQVRGATITTAADIYSLGVILYYLLTGCLPYNFEGKPSPDIESVVCEKDPLRPSQACGGPKRQMIFTGERESTAERISKNRGTTPKNLRRQLTGDLDNIILMSMHKEPSRRYSSVAEFSKDIRHYLSGVPVNARQTTLFYRTAKFVRRHKTGVVSAVLVLLSLLAGLAAAVWQNTIARQQRDLAMEAANSMVFELAEGLSRMSGPTEDRLGLLAKASEIYDKINRSANKLSPATPQEADARRMLARTYRMLGNNSLALQQAREAEHISRQLYMKDSRYLVLLCATMVELGDALVANGREPEGMSFFREVIADLLIARADSGDYPRVNRLRYSAYLRLGDRLFYRSTLDSARGCYQQAYTISSRMLQTRRDNAEFQTLHATSIERLADMCYYSGQMEESYRKYDEALALRREACRQAPRDPQMLRALSIALQNTGWCREQQGDIPAAVRAYNESIDIQQRLHSLDPSNTFYSTALMGGLGTRANILEQQGKTAAAAEDYSRAITIGRESAVNTNGDPRILKKTADISRLLGELQIHEKQYAAAECQVDSARTILEKLLETDSLNTDYQRSLVLILSAKGDIQTAYGDPEQALVHYRQAGELCRRIINTNGTMPDRRIEARIAYCQGVALARLSKPDLARESFLQAKKILLDLKSKGYLSEDSDEITENLPAIEKALLHTPE